MGHNIGAKQIHWTSKKVFEVFKASFLSYQSFAKTYLKCHFRISHHTSKPAQSCIYEAKDGEKGDQICCNVGNETY